MKDIPGFDGYLATKDGKIYSKKAGRYIKQRLNEFGYFRVTLWVNRKNKHAFVHRLVALAYLPNPSNLPFINHMDGVRTNNHLDNLEWCTAKYNTQHSIKAGRHPVARTRALSAARVKEIRMLSTSGLRKSQIAKQLGLSWDAVRDVVDNRRYVDY